MEFDVLVLLRDWLEQRDKEVITALQPAVPIKHHELLSIGKDRAWHGSVWLKLKGQDQIPVFETRMYVANTGDSGPTDYKVHDPQSFENVYRHIFGTKHETV